MSQTPETGQPARKRRWFRFSLLWLLCVVLTTAALGWVSWSCHRTDTRPSFADDGKWVVIPEHLYEQNLRSGPFQFDCSVYGWPLRCRQIAECRQVPSLSCTRIEYLSLAVDMGLCLLTAAGFWTAVWWTVGRLRRGKKLAEGPAP
jgi:hypothetical protein